MQQVQSDADEGGTPAAAAVGYDEGQERRES